MAIEEAVPPYRKESIHSKIMEALLASGCDDDARLAFHAEGAGKDDLVVRYGSRAGRRASELAAHREAAAQYSRALRCAMATDSRTRAELSDALAQELSLVDRWDESAEMRTAALELWRETGDLRRESQSLLRLSVAKWRLCRGAEAREAREAALALAQECGSGPEIARAYERMASHELAEARYEQGIAMARQAREMAEQLRLTDVISDSLDTEAKAVRAMGEDWAVPMRSALDSALSGGHEEQAGRAFARAYLWYCEDLRPEEAERSYGDAFAYCEEHDIRTEACWLEGRLDAAVSELDRVRSFSAGATAVDRSWIAIWTRRLGGVAQAVDIEPFASQLAGEGARAAMLWDRLSYRYEAALALFDTKAEALLRESLARLVDLGAEAAARLVRGTMRDLGMRSVPAGARKATLTHPRGLTTREQQILQLLSKGRSNEEISAELFISVRAVEHHVTAILTKLRVPTRQGAAKEAIKLGLTHSDGLSVAMKSR